MAAWVPPPGAYRARAGSRPDPSHVYMTTAGKGLSSRSQCCRTITIPWRTFTASNLQRATPKRYHIQSNTTVIRYHSCISSDRDTIRLIDQARARGIASVASVRSATTRAHAPVKIRVRKEKRRSVDNDSPPPSHPTGTGAPSFEFWLNARHYGFCTHAASIKQNSAAP